MKSSHNFATATDVLVARAAVLVAESSPVIYTWLLQFALCIIKTFHSQEWSISNSSCSLTRNITSHSMENLAFHSLLRWKTIILPILTTSLIHLSKTGRIGSSSCQSNRTLSTRNCSSCFTTAVVIILTFHVLRFKNVISHTPPRWNC